MILARYLSREVAVPFLLGLFVLTLLFLLNQVARLSDLFVGRGVSLMAIGKLLWVLTPPFLLVTLPAAMLLAGIVAFSRLSSESEFTAMKAAGVPFYRMMWPVAVLSLLVAAATLTIGITTEPWGKGKLKNLARETLRTHTQVAVSPGTFSEPFDGVLVFAEQVDERGTLSNIFVSDDRHPDRPLLVTARTGRLFSSEDSLNLGFRLTGGEIYRPGETFQRVRFDEYTITLRVTEQEETLMTGKEVRAELARRKAANEPVGHLLQQLLDGTRNVTLGVACLLFGLLGPALGVHLVRTGRSGGFATGVGVIVGYYAVMSFSQALVIGEYIPLQAGAWLPNGVLLMLTGYALIRTQLELPLRPGLLPKWRRRRTS